MKNSTKKITIGLAVLLVSITSSGCSVIPKEGEEVRPALVKPQKLKYKTILVKKGDIQLTIKHFGYFKSTEREDLYFDYQGGVLENLYVKLGETVKKGDKICSLRKKELDYGISEQELIWKKAVAIYEELISKKVSKEELRVAETNVELEKLRLENLKEQIKDGVIYAPFDGKITYLTDIPRGTKIGIDTIVARIENKDSIILESNIKKNLDYIEEGMEAKVRYRGEIVNGKVSYINRENGKNFKAGNEVVIKIDELSSKINIGDKADFEIVGQHKKDALIVPKNAIYNLNNGKFVQELVDGIKFQQFVELGIESDKYIEIVSGVKEGDELVVK